MHGAWLCFQLANGVYTTTPSARPSHTLARREGSSDPCVQSWNIM